MKKRFQLRETALQSAHGAGATVRARGAEEPDSVLSALSVADLQRAELWGAELPRMVEEAGRSESFRPKPAVKMLAGWARLARLDAQVLPAPEGPDDPLLEAQAYVDQNGAALAEVIVGSFNAEAWAGAWLARAQQLKDSYQGDGNVGGAGAAGFGSAGFGAAGREEAGRSLLLDLDDLELVDYACRRFGQADPEVARAVASCGRWLAANADAFLSCGQRVRAELAMMRRDLPTVDRELARTTLKFLHVRSAVEEMEEDLDFAASEGHRG